MVGTSRTEMIGRRIRLVRTSDQYTLLTPGSLGVVEMVDAIGTIFIAWDSGSRLGLVPDEDLFEFID
jgi:hypothetical protein